MQGIFSRAYFSVIFRNSLPAFFLHLFAFSTHFSPYKLPYQLFQIVAMKKRVDIVKELSSSDIITHVAQFMAFIECLESCTVQAETIKLKTHFSQLEKVAWKARSFGVDTDALYGLMVRYNFNSFSWIRNSLNFKSIFFFKYITHT